MRVSLLLLLLLPASQDGRERKVLVLGIDGLRPDALAAARTPHLDGLIRDGCYSDAAQGEDLTFSGPNWATILHGVHRDRHRVTSNDYKNHRLKDHPDFLARLEKHDPDLVTVRLTTWDELHRNQPTGADIDQFHDYSKDDGDRKVTEHAAALLAGRHPRVKDDPDAVFVYWGNVDEAGHAHGFHPETKEYLAAIEVVDGYVGRLLKAIRSRPRAAREDWLVVMTSDHGGSADGKHSGGTPEKRTIPFLVSGRSVAKGTPFPAPKNVDVSRTVLAFMGVPDDPALDGRAVGLAPSAPAPAGTGRNLIFNGDAEADRGFGGFLPDQAVSGWEDAGPHGVTVVRYGAPKGFPSPDDPGPEGRGRNFFAGGQAEGPTSLRQTIPLGPLRDRPLGFTLSGWLGGFADQGDEATVTARFLDGDRKELSSAVIGPVTLRDRKGRTGLHRRETAGDVPAGTAFVEIVLAAVRRDGSNDGYADNLSLVLRAR